MATRRVHIRPPGVKTGSTIGPLGPFRGTLGIQWVVGTIAVGVVIVMATSYLLFRPPSEPFERIDGVRIEQIAPGTGREVQDGIYLGRTSDGQPFALTRPAPNCDLEFTGGHYVDCKGTEYTVDGRGRGPRADDLTRLPVEIHRSDVYVDASAVAG